MNQDGWEKVAALYLHFDSSLDTDLGVEECKLDEATDNPASWLVGH